MRIYTIDTNLIHRVKGEYLRKDFQLKLEKEFPSKE